VTGLLTAHTANITIRHATASDICTEMKFRPQTMMVLGVEPRSYYFIISYLRHHNTTCAVRGMLTDPYTASWHICMHCVKTQATPACSGHLKRPNKAASHQYTYSLHCHLPHVRHDTLNRRL